MACRSTPKVPSTAPRGRSRSSSTGPCSMCNSKYAAAFFNSLPDSFTRSKSIPTFFKASGSLIPCLSTRPRAFFIGPTHKAHGYWRLAMVLRIDAAKNFHARHYIETAVQPATVRHGIKVAADEQTFVRCAAQGEPRVASGVVVNFERQPFDCFAQKFPRCQPGFSEGDALRAVFVAGEHAEFLQFGDGAFGIKQDAHTIYLNG